MVCLFFNRGEKLSPTDVQILPIIPFYQFRPQSIGIILFQFLVWCYILLNRTRADALHIHGDWNGFFLAGILKKALRADTLYFSIHGSIGQYKGLRRKWLMKSVGKADRVFCSGYDSFMQIRSVSRALFQPSGIRNAFFEDPGIPKQPSFTIITVAKLVPVKNLFTVLEIASRISDCRFILVGDGPQKKKLMEKTTRLGLQNIDWKGHLADVEIVQEMHKSHLFLLTSFREGTPTAVLEAMACGLPVVCSAAGGISRLLENGVNGFIIEETVNAEAYCQKILQLKADETLRKRISSTNRERAGTFRWETVAGSIDSIMTDE